MWHNESQSKSAPCSLLQGLTSQGNAGELTLVVRMKENWKANQPYNYQDPHPKSWVGLPQFPPHPWFAEAGKEPGSADPKLPRIDSVTETKGLEPDQRLFAINTYK